MTEARAHAGWADVANDIPARPARPAAAEARGQDLPIIDTALFLAFEGDLRLAARLPDEADRRAVFSAARCFGVVVPEGMDARPLPFSDVADRLAASRSATNLFLAAEKLGGDRTRGEKAKRVGATVAKAATLLVDLPLSVASTAAGKLGHQRAAAGLEITSAVARAVVQSPFDRLNEAGPNKLFHAVRRFVKGYYGIDYNNNPRLVLAWLRATMLGRAAQSPYTSNETMESLVLDFWGASQGFVLREHAKDKQLAEDFGIPRLRTALRNRVDAREAAVQFLNDQAKAKAAREKANRDYFRPKPSKRPSGFDLEVLRIAADTYNMHLISPYDLISVDMKDAAELISTDRYEEGVLGLTELMSVALERSRLVGDPDAPRFKALFEQYARDEGFFLVEYLRQNLFVLSDNLASGAQLRLADDIIHRSKVWGAFWGADKDKLERALVKGAFDWFDYPYDTFKHMPEVVRAVHRAHIQAIAGLAGPASLGGVRRSRARALLDALPSDKRKREQTEKCLPRAAVGQLEAARRLLGRRS